MGRRKNITPSIEKTICLPIDLVVKVDLVLYSELEDRVPFGAWQKLITELLNRWLTEQKGGPT